MVETICNKVTLKIRNKMPEIDDERAEVINYGLQLMVGEIPKTIILLIIAYLCGVFKLSLLALLIVTPYRALAGGAHFTTHIECMIATLLFYTGNALLSKYLRIYRIVKIIISVIVWIFGIIIIKKYVPADTEAVPVLRKQERKIKRILSYIVISIMLIVAVIIKNEVISNIVLIATILETFALTPIMYKITRNRYGYADVYKNIE